jgi:ABC-type Zn uptake system ZnuABC Zn-binding protein ZnuA
LTVDQLVAACARSGSKRTQAIGLKLADLAAKATAELRVERELAEKKRRHKEEIEARRAAVRAEREAARAEVQRLARELAEAKAKLVGRDPAASYVCEDCGEKFGSPQGRGAHAFRRHGRRTAK